MIEKNDTWLFIFRLKRWDLPKGKLDPGEGPEEAAIRECEEECGITKLTITSHLEPTYHIYEHKGGYALKKTFWYTMSTQHEGTLVPQLEEHIERVEWFNKPQINEIVLSNTYPAILQVIKNIA
ncbi:MAG: NUDIX domain-containing protein [Bacteroidetes bacterium]|nr:NUDIX domain-containing protein [Bacteroidota bacterium]